MTGDDKIIQWPDDHSDIQVLKQQVEALRSDNADLKRTVYTMRELDQKRMHLALKTLGGLVLSLIGVLGYYILGIKH